MVKERINALVEVQTSKHSSPLHICLQTLIHIYVYMVHYRRWTNQPRASPSFGGSQRVREWKNLIRSSSYFPAKAHTLLYNARWTEFWTNFLFFSCIWFTNLQNLNFLFILCSWFCDSFFFCRFLRVLTLVGKFYSSR